MKRLGYVVAAAAVGSLVTVAVAQQTGASGRRVVRMTAERFAFTPSEIVVDVGEEIEIRLKSDDTAHGFRIIGTATNVTIPKRGKGEITTVVRADKPGKYTFECSRMCGAGHNFMRGTLVVRERGADNQ